MSKTYKVYLLKLEGVAAFLRKYVRGARHKFVGDPNEATHFRRLTDAKNSMNHRKERMEIIECELRVSPVRKIELK